MSKPKAVSTNLDCTLEQDAPAPLYQQLFERLRAQILTGRLAAETRLPSTRVLASTLGVSRNTTARAYEQLLLEGYVESKVGDGTRVACPRPEQVRQTAERQSAEAGSERVPAPAAALSERARALLDMPIPEDAVANQTDASRCLFPVV